MTVAAGPRWRWWGSNHFWILLFAVLTVAASKLMTIVGGDRVRLLGLPELPQMCHFRSMFHLPCPGCGLTRAFISMGHGRLIDAWYYHPVGVFFYLIVVAQIPFQSWQLWRARRGMSPTQLGTAPQWIWGLLVFAALLQWVVRLLT